MTHELPMPQKILYSNKPLIHKWLIGFLDLVLIPLQSLLPIELATPLIWPSVYYGLLIAMIL